MIVTVFCKAMNRTSTFALITAIAVFTFVVIGRIFFVSNPAYAYSSCKSVNNQLTCTTSPDEVCSFYSPNQVICGTRNTPGMPFG